jgi:hypothetical protein
MGQQQLLLIILGVIIVGIAIAVGLSMFSAQSVQSNKDAIINDLNNIAANAYQYKIRPTSMGGGSGAYNGGTYGYTIPSKMVSNANASYAASGVSATSVTLTGTSAQYTGASVVATLNSNGELGSWTYNGDFQ